MFTSVSTVSSWSSQWSSLPSSKRTLGDGAMVGIYFWENFGFLCKKRKLSMIFCKQPFLCLAVDQAQEPSERPPHLVLVWYPFEEKLGKSVTFCTDCVGPEVEAMRILRILRHEWISFKQPWTVLERCFSSKDHDVCRLPVQTQPLAAWSCWSFRKAQRRKKSILQIIHAKCREEDGIVDSRPCGSWTEQIATLWPDALLCLVKWFKLFVESCLAISQSGWALFGLSSRTWMVHALLLLYQCFATVDSHRLSLLSLIAFAFENGISLDHLEPMVLELWEVALRTKMQSLAPHKHRTKRVATKESCWPISMVFSCFFDVFVYSFLILASYLASLLPVPMQVGFLRLHVSTEHFSTQLLPLHCRLIQVTLHNSLPVKPLRCCRLGIISNSKWHVQHVQHDIFWFFPTS